jgi:hypothetical protein
MRSRWLKLAAVCVLAVLWPAHALTAGGDAYSGTWSGGFDIHFADGRVLKDTAWLVLQQNGTRVAGTAGPKAEEQAPIRDVSVSGRELRFIADSTQGKYLTFVLKRDGERLSGVAQGDIGDDHVRVMVDVARIITATATAAAAAAAPAPAPAPAPDALYQRMLALDTAMFDSFNKCSDPAELKKHAAFFARDVEFFHDLGGVTLGVDALIASTRQNVCGKFRRELDLASLRVYPIPGYGAMTFGTHRFCHTPTTCEGIAEFSMVWKEQDGAWQITRALSYAHRSLN